MFIERGRRIPLRRTATVVLAKEGIVTKEGVPILVWPFYALWRLVVFMLKITGRLMGVLLGLVVFTFGLLLSLTVVGAVVGIPLMILGLLLMLRGLF